MTMENRAGIKVNLICGRCKKMFLRPAITIKPEQKYFFCSRECLKKSPEEKSAIRKETRKKWIDANKQRHLDGRKKWRLKNMDRVKESKKKDYLIHKDKRIERKKIYCINNREKIREHHRRYYRNNRDKILMRATEWRKNNQKRLDISIKLRRDNNRDLIIQYRIKKAAKDSRVKFDLTREWIKERLNSGVCEMTGLPFDMEGKRTPNSPSVDRIRPGGDYTMDNCRIILWAMNRALSNYGEDYMFKIFEAALAKKVSI